MFLTKDSISNSIFTYNMTAFANLNLINFLLFMTCFHINKKDGEIQSTCNTV